MDAIEMFLIRHERLHAHVERLPEGLREQQIREPVGPDVNPLAWLLWHMARAEDGAINRLVCDEPQVLDRDWSSRLRIERRDVGTGMTMIEVVALSAGVHLPSLIAYWQAVGRRTADLIASLRPSDLDQVVDRERLRRVLQELVQGPARGPLQELWENTSRGRFLVWLPLTHNYEHVGQADLIRGLLGRPGHF